MVPDTNTLSGAPAVGVNQTRARDHNERLLLSLIHRQEALPGSELARQAGLSPQTVSVILRQLERDGIVEKGEPIRGKVGKPSVPMRLAPDGILSVGLKIGRRSAEMVLMDVSGAIRFEDSVPYRYPLPDQVFGFLEAGLARIQRSLDPAAVRRITGIGIALPFGMWKWHDALGAPADQMEAWRTINIAERLADFTDLPVHVENDATAACRAENVFGVGTQTPDFAYFFVGAFVGGGLSLNGSVWPGRTGNAGAFGSLPVGDGGTQLIDHASLYRLENTLAEAGIEIDLAGASAEDFLRLGPPLDAWLSHAARHLARGAISLAAVIDFETVVVDGRMPARIRQRLVARTEAALAREDSRGVTLPALREGTIGPKARAIGAAALPIFSQFFLNMHAARV